MKEPKNLKTPALGDFTSLADAYGASRPDYSPDVLSALIDAIGKPIEEVDFVDVGAGTGIWTRMVAERGPRSVIAVEPNSEMRRVGQSVFHESEWHWVDGSAESTGLPESRADWVTMASSFHWTNVPLALAEFARILRPEGSFTALWNPRVTWENPRLLSVEEKIRDLLPGRKRVSSGFSDFTENLVSQLSESGFFDSVSYFEASHSILMDRERYLLAWQSANDIQSAMGAQVFSRFIEFVERLFEPGETIEVKYLTRAWHARFRQRHGKLREVST